MGAAPIEVRHDEARHRFEADVDGHRCVAEYVMRDGAMWMTHTYVPAAVGGRGIAAALVRVALAHARAHHLTVVPACSYVATYLARHPDALG